MQLLALLDRRFGSLHLRKGDAHLLSILKTQAYLLLGRVILDDLCLTERRLYHGVALGRALLEVLVRVKLVAQTAHEPPAGTRDLGCVERQVLLLGHSNGDGLQPAT